MSYDNINIIEYYTYKKHERLLVYETSKIYPWFVVGQEFLSIIFSFICHLDKYNYA